MNFKEYLLRMLKLAWTEVIVVLKKKPLNIRVHTVGPVRREVPESAMAAQPPAQKPER